MNQADFPTPWIRPYSKESRVQRRAHYRIVNRTDKQIELFWFDFDGNRVSYGVLGERRHSIDIDTFETHPWQAVDTDTGKAVLLNGEFIFKPTVIPRRVRRIVLISKPKPSHSLKSLCLDIVNELSEQQTLPLAELPHSVTKDLTTLKQYGFTI